MVLRSKSMALELNGEELVPVATGIGGNQKVRLSSGGSGNRTHGGLHLTAFQARPDVPRGSTAVALSWILYWLSSSQFDPIGQDAPEFMARNMAKPSAAFVGAINC